ncbi:his Kinase A (Phosphoacceptor) domain./Histidine kinase-DNA gyrase B-and HSP90-like ATPase./Hpt domain./Response regulator receiver domain [Mycoplasma sp. CAG:877]|nr:his Kinase A (Phosphoacceptor) domain./Histidine kinase-DNA gyrase B-and HSP90-like ATPase./Hpt domain./Response regulator receiver domain [Mycoplasma sp. CAG:877]
MVNISFSVCSLVFSLILLVVYFSKKRIDNKETKIFSKILICTLLGVIIEIICYFFRINDYGSGDLIYIIINKLILIYYVWWGTLLLIYVNIISSKEKYNKYYIIFCFLLSLVVFVLKLDFVLIKNLLIPSGLSLIFVYGMSSIYIMIAVITMLTNFKRNLLKKYFPLLGFVLFGSIAMVIQIIKPQLLLITFVHTIIIYLMYFTIENPDMQMVEQLEKAKNEADRANRAKTDFLSSMSHEIRTPLNAIVGFSDCIVNSNSLTDAKENAKDIVNASKTLLEIVNGILDISKIESGKMELVCISYDSRAAFREVANLLIPKMEEKGLKFSSYIAPDVPAVLYGDVNNVKKIISNLLSNAVKYTDKGFIRYEVSCVNDGDTSRLVISVEDSGRGIKQDAVKNLFSKFQRLDEDRNTTIEGTGLGLAITKQLIDLMGGQIAVHTVYGSGSKFTVMIPQKISTEVIKIESEIEKPKVIQKDIDLAAAKILIVDDNNLNLKVASKLLEKQGASNITCVNSGFACLDKISMGEKYDLIFMDDMMPKMSGKETFLKLKAISGFITPVVALTANAISGSKEEYLKVGFSDYLAKPIEKSELARVLGSVLKEKEEVVSTVTVVDNKELDEKAETKEEYLRRNGVNVDKALELLGDMNMYEVTLKDFLNSIDKKWENIKKYKEEGDLANYSIEVHSLKSDCKYLGFTKLANISFLHELKSKDGDKEYIDKHFSDLEDAYNVAIKIMKGV